MLKFDNADQVLFTLYEMLKKQRVLIVDRHQSARNAMRTLFSSIGVTQVHGVGSSLEALRQVRKNSYDIIVADYLLDDERDGQQLLEEFRHKQLIPLNTIYIVSTAERNYQSVLSVAELAPDDYLLKPFTADQMQQRLARSLHRKQAFTDIYRNYEHGDYDKAIKACDRVAERSREYLYEVYRFKGELLNTVGRYADATELYESVLGKRPLPWARMGLAHAIHGLGRSAAAATMAAELIEEFPTYLSAYDFLARVREESGNLSGAQEALQRAIANSPRNTLRQRELGEIAMRNGDYRTAEQAFALALERSRGSSLNELDDYTNLSRAYLEQDKAEAAQAVAKELRKDRRGDQQAELAALVVDALAFEVSDLPEQAQATLNRAIDLHSQIGAAQANDGKNGQPLSSRLSVDLGRACLAFGIKEKGIDLLRQVAAENLDNPSLMAHIQHVFTQTGDPEAGKALLDEVAREIVAINNRGVLKAREGDLEGAVELLIEAAERMPNLQFLVNASKAIFTLLDKIGWDEKLADQARRYALRARAKEPANAKVISAWSLYQQVGAKYGINVPPMNIAAAAAGND